MVLPAHVPKLMQADMPRQSHLLQMPLESGRQIVTLSKANQMKDESSGAHMRLPDSLEGESLLWLNVYPEIVTDLKVGRSVIKVEVHAVAKFHPET